MAKAFIIIFVSVMMGACASMNLGPERVVSIQEVQAAPEKFENQEVRVQGKITDISKLIFWRKGAIYRIFSEDNTHSIWIFTKNKNIPPRGTVVLVHGVVRKGTRVGKAILGHVISEKTREIKQAP